MAAYKPPVPKAWTDIYRYGAILMVQAEAATQAALHATRNDSILKVIPKAKGNQTAVLMAIRGISQSMEKSIAKNLIDSKKAARLKNRKYFLAENLRLNKESNGQIKVIYNTPDHEYIEDVLASEAASKSFTAYWVALAMALALGDDTNKIGNTAKLTDARLDRIAATEIARSFNAEHDKALEDLVQANSEMILAGKVYQRWDAQLDRRTCAYCASQDGVIASLDEEFDIPSHQNCRCISTLIYL